MCIDALCNVHICALHLAKQTNAPAKIHALRLQSALISRTDTPNYPIPCWSLGGGISIKITIRNPKHDLGQALALALGSRPRPKALSQGPGL